MNEVSREVIDTLNEVEQTLIEAKKKIISLNVPEARGLINAINRAAREKRSLQDSLNGCFYM